MKTIHELTDTLVSGTLDRANDLLPIWDHSAGTTKKIAVSDVAETAEPPLGNPSVTGHVLSSTTAGVRSWVAPDVYQVMCASGGGSFNSIKYGTFGFMTLLTQDYAKMVFPTAVVMDRLYALCYSSSSGTITTGYARIIKNGVETLLSANWVDGGVSSDLVNSVSFAAGDTVSIIYHPGTGTVDNAVISVRVKTALI